MVQLANSVSPTTTTTSTLTGVSPIGTSSPNTGSTAATNSTYGQGAFASGINDQGAGTAYTVQNTDYQGYIQFNTASAVTITLNQAVGTNYTTTILNLGTGPITLSPNGSLTVNGAASLTLQPGVGAQVFFANRAWKAYSGATAFPIVPATTAAVPHQWFDAYDATTGIFTKTQPAFADISGNLTGSQLPVAGISATITTAKLTAGGANGSMTFVNGQLTAQVQST
jgi:hypothetical protein